MAVIQCGACQAELGVDDRLLGTQVRCGHCSRTFIAHSASTEPISQATDENLLDVSLPTPKSNRGGAEGRVFRDASARIKFASFGMLVLACLGLLASVVIWTMGLIALMAPKGPRDGGVIAVMLLFGLVVAMWYSLIGYAGHLMGQFRNAPMVWIGVTFCLCSGLAGGIPLIVGILGIVAMSDRTVRRAFRIVAGDPIDETRDDP